MTSRQHIEELQELLKDAGWMIQHLSEKIRHWERGMGIEKSDVDYEGIDELWFKIQEAAYPDYGD